MSSNYFNDLPLLQSGRYIVFLIDSKCKQHDGMIFSSYQDAKEFASDCLDGIFADKAVIGFFSLSKDREMFISDIETIGFKKDKKNINQFELFKNYGKSNI